MERGNGGRGEIGKGKGSEIKNLGKKIGEILVKREDGEADRKLGMGKGRGRGESDRNLK